MHFLEGAGVAQGHVHSGSPLLHLSLLWSLQGTATPPLNSASCFIVVMYIGARERRVETGGRCIYKSGSQMKFEKWSVLVSSSLTGTCPR